LRLSESHNLWNDHVARTLTYDDADRPSFADLRPSVRCMANNQSRIHVTAVHVLDVRIESQTPVSQSLSSRLQVKPGKVGHFDDLGENESRKLLCRPRKTCEESHYENHGDQPSSPFLLFG